MKSTLLKISYEHFTRYSNWLKSQDLSDHDIRAQLCRLNHFLVFIGTVFSGNESIYTNSFRRDDALREYKLYLRKNLKSPGSTVNVTIESIDKFFQFVGLEGTRIEPDVQEPLRALDEEQLSRFNGVVRSRPTARERAIVRLLLDAGVLPEECALIDLNDVRLATTGGTATVGSGAARRQLSLDSTCRLTIREYLTERAENYPYPDCSALFIDERGNRLTASAVDLIVRQVGREAGLLAISARTVQQTFQYHEAKRQNQALLAVELMNGAVHVR